MNGNNIIADTSLLINFFNGVAASKRFIEDRTLFVSVITEIELLSFPNLTAVGKKLIKSFLEECIIIDLEEEIKEITIELKTKNKLKLPDAIIAATAIRFDLPLFTMDKDFKKITGLNSVIIEL